MMRKLAILALSGLLLVGGAAQAANPNAQPKAGAGAISGSNKPSGKVVHTPVKSGQKAPVKH